MASSRFFDQTVPLALVLLLLAVVAPRGAEGFRTEPDLSNVLDGAGVSDEASTDSDQSRVGAGDGKDGVSGRIFGGNDVAAGTYPYFVGLDSPNDMDLSLFFCNGVVVDTLYVLTAAGCFPADMPRDPITVVLNPTSGQNDDPSAETRGVDEVIIFDDFVFSDISLNDFALLKLDSPVPSSITPATINTDPSLPTDGLPVTVVGTGITSAVNTTPPAVVQDANLAVSTAADCSALAPGIINNTIHLCAFDSTLASEPCLFDFGGPLLDSTTETVYGVFSTPSSNCDGVVRPTLFARITPDVVAWIDAVTAPPPFATPAPSASPGDDFTCDNNKNDRVKVKKGGYILTRKCKIIDSYAKQNTFCKREVRRVKYFGGLWEVPDPKPFVFEICQNECFLDTGCPHDDEDEDYGDCDIWCLIYHWFWYFEW